MTSIDLHNNVSSFSGSSSSLSARWTLPDVSDTTSPLTTSVKLPNDVVTSLSSSGSETDLLGMHMINSTTSSVDYHDSNSSKETYLRWKSLPSNSTDYYFSLGSEDDDSGSSMELSVSAASPWLNGSRWTYGSDDSDDDAVWKYWTLWLLVFPVLTVFGNVLVVMGVYRERSLRSATNYFIVSLAIADIMVAILVMPLAVYVEVNDSLWQLGDALCDTWVALDVGCCTASILNLAAISVDRYIAVTRPIQYAKHKNSKRVYVMLALTWVISAAISSPIALGMNYTDSRLRTPTLCTFYNSDFLIYSSMGSFYIPCVIVVILYWRIFHAIKTRARKSASISSSSFNNKLRRATNRSSTTFSGSLNGQSPPPDITSSSPAFNNDESCTTKTVETQSKWCLKSKRKPSTISAASESATEIDEDRRPSIKRRLKSFSRCRQRRDSGTDARPRLTCLPQFADNISVVTRDKNATGDAKRCDILSSEGWSLSSPVVATDVTNISLTDCDNLTLSSAVKTPDSNPTENYFSTSLFEQRQQEEQHIIEKQNGDICHNNLHQSASVYSVQTRHTSLSTHRRPTYGLARRSTAGRNSLCQNHDLENDQGQGNSPSVGGTSVSRRTLSGAHRRERKATKTLAIVLGVFLFCWVPFFTLNMIKAICMRYDLLELVGVCQFDPILFSFFVWLGYINSFLNPVIYTIFNVEFRRAFKRLLCSTCVK